MDDEALGRLRSSVAEFNRWRRGRPGGPDLRKADLAGLDLSGADLHEAHLFGADLRGTKLVGADLRDVHLDEAVLEGADLSRSHGRRAHLVGARLQRARLVKADLRQANLERADLSQADLTGADLRDSHLLQTLLAGTVTERANFHGARITAADGNDDLAALGRALAGRATFWRQVRGVALLVCTVLFLGFGPDWRSIVQKGELEPNRYLAARVNLFTGQNLLIRDRYPEAEKRLRRAVDQDPTLREGWAWLAFVLDARGEHREAERCFRRFMGLKPSKSEVEELKETVDLYASKEEARTIRRLLEEKGY